jgi:hypothetical protein
MWPGFTGSRQTRILLPAAIILAPPGSGKSHYALESGQRAALDGDTIVGAGPGWPGWEWKEPGTPESNFAAWDHFVAIVTASAVLRRPVLFNGKVFPRPNTWIGTVVVGPDAIARNMKNRPSAVPGYLAKLEGNIRSMSLPAVVNGGVFTEFPSAIKAAQAWLDAHFRPLIPNPKRDTEEGHHDR